MRRSSALTILALSVALASAARAQTTVYDNGLPDGVSGNDMSAWVQAQGFSLTSSATIEQIRFWDIEFGQTYSGNGFQWWIFASAAGDPGAILYNGLATPTREAQGAGCCSSNRFQNDLFIDAVALGPGSYYLGLHDNSNGQFTNIFWESTAFRASGREQFWVGMDSWSETTGTDHAFQLVGRTAEPSSVPEPSSIVLMATGLLGMAGVRRWRHTGRGT